jgi:hypothetical protein
MDLNGRLERLERNVDEMMKMLMDIHKEIGNMKYKTGYIAGIVAFAVSLITSGIVFLKFLIR